MAAEARQGKRQKQHQRSMAPASSTSSSMRGGSGRNCPRRRRPKRTKSEAQVGGEHGRTWAATFNGAGGVARGGRRRRSPSRRAVQVVSRGTGASGRRRCCWSRAGPRFWCWSRRRSRRAAAQVGSRRWLQGAGDGGGGRKEMDFFVTCLKLCGFFCKKTNTLPCGQLFPDGGSTS